MEAVRWNKDRSVVRIATAGSRRKTVTTDVILAGFLACVLISFSSSGLSGMVAVTAGVLIVAAIGVALFAARRLFPFPYVELGEAGVKVHKRYWTTFVPWKDVIGFSDHQYRGDGGVPGGARVWQLCVDTRSSRVPLRCEVATVSKAERNAIVASLRPFEQAHDLTPMP